MIYKTGYLYTILFKPESRFSLMRFLFVAILLGTTSFGQNSLGTIAGTVRDPWGVALAEATVQASNARCVGRLVVRRLDSSTGKWANLTGVGHSWHS
jgi:hypothetical protein